MDFRLYEFLSKVSFLKARFYGLLFVFPSLRVPLSLFGLPGFAVCFAFFQISLRVLASWFLDVAFQVMFQMAVISEADVITFCTQDCHWSGLVPLLWLPGGQCHHFGVAWDHFGSLGAPWRTMGAAGLTHDGPEADFSQQSFYDFATISGITFHRFSGTED